MQNLKTSANGLIKYSYIRLIKDFYCNFRSEMMFDNVLHIILMTNENQHYRAIQ